MLCKKINILHKETIFYYCFQYFLPQKLRTSCVCCCSMVWLPSGRAAGRLPGLAQPSILAHWVPPHGHEVHGQQVPTRAHGKTSYYFHTFVNIFFIFFSYFDLFQSVRKRRRTVPSHSLHIFVILFSYYFHIIFILFF